MQTGRTTHNASALRLDQCKTRQSSIMMVTRRHHAHVLAGFDGTKWGITIQLHGWTADALAYCVKNTLILRLSICRYPKPAEW
jgi:hypothetical protein